MKKSLSVFCISLMLILVVSANAYALENSGIGTTINGIPVQYNETSGYPFVDSNYRTLVPLRAAMEAYGCTVNWIQETQTAVVSLDNVTVNVPVGYSCIYVNGVKQETDTQATVLEGRIFLPIRAVLEAFGATVSWDGANNCVKVTSNTLQNTEDEPLDSIAIAKKCSPAVFYIAAFESEDALYYAQGSGFFVTSDGVAVTNFHVIENTTYAYVLTTDNKVYPVIRVLHTNPAEDIAIIKVSKTAYDDTTVDSFPFLELGDSDKVLTGQKVYAIGNPLGMQNTMSEGIVSNNDQGGRIQISAPIDHGSSGGALLDEYGKAIGITSSGYDSVANIGFAIPINKVKQYSFKVAGYPYSHPYSNLFTTPQIVPQKSMLKLELNEPYVLEVDVYDSSENDFTLYYAQYNEDVVKLEFLENTSTGYRIQLTALKNGASFIGLRGNKNDDYTIVSVLAGSGVSGYAEFPQIPSIDAYAGIAHEYVETEYEPDGKITTYNYNMRLWQNSTTVKNKFDSYDDLLVLYGFRLTVEGYDESLDLPLYIYTNSETNQSVALSYITAGYNLYYTIILMDFLYV